MVCFTIVKGHILSFVHSNDDGHFDLLDQVFLPI